MFGRAFAVMAMMSSMASVAFAQLVDQRDVGGKSIMCVRSGLSSDLKDCGTKSNWYAFVFVGSIAAITTAKNDEMKIQIVPEEVFFGAPKNPLTVETSQGLCLPRLAVGDRWLFYLRKEQGKPIVLDYSGNDSRPVANAEKEIETLRKLKTIGDFAILRGEVIQGAHFSQGPPLANAHVFAVQNSDQQQFVSTTDAYGRYEFQPLPAGNYTISVEKIGSYQPEETEMEIKAGECWDVTLAKNPSGTIAGHVTRSNGLPAQKFEVVLVDADNLGYITTQTDNQGRFEFNLVEPGEYVVGFNYPPNPSWFNGAGGGAVPHYPPAGLFYPGVSKRSDAQVINLHVDEKLETIDATLPAN